MSSQCLAFRVTSNGSRLDVGEMEHLKTSLLSLGPEVRAAVLWTDGSVDQREQDLQMDPTEVALVEEVAEMLARTVLPLLGIAVGHVGAVGSWLLRNCDHVVAEPSAGLMMIWADQFDLRASFFMSVQEAAHMCFVDDIVHLEDIHAKCGVIVQMFHSFESRELILIKIRMNVARIKAISNAFQRVGSAV